MSSDLTFITNEAGKSLRDRFGVLLGDDTRLFDCLVGYFFISGFHRLHPALTKTEKIRILIGIKTDGATYELIQTAKEQQEFVLESHAQVRERVPGEILGELQKSGDSWDIEDGVHKFVEWIKSGKLEVRAYPSERVHAKLYIMTFHEGDRDKGRVITGSSNFTEAGLQNNLEFNVELKNRSDYDFALQKFNELWAKSVDVTKDYVTTIEVKSPFAQFTPYELYLKFLYEYFRGELNLPDEIEDMYLPTGFKKLKYQESALRRPKRQQGHVQGSPENRLWEALPPKTDGLLLFLLSQGIAARKINRSREFHNNELLFHCYLCRQSPPTHKRICCRLRCGEFREGETLSQRTRSAQCDHNADKRSL